MSFNSCGSYSLEYIRKVAGPRTVPVELGSSYAKEDWTQTLMTVSQLIDQHILNEVKEKNKQCQWESCRLALFVHLSQRQGDSPSGYLAQHHLFDQVWASNFGLTLLSF